MTTATTARPRKRKIKGRVRKAHEQALAEYAEKNPEIAQALEAMKRAQLVRNFRAQVLDRFSYQSL